MIPEGEKMKIRTRHSYQLHSEIKVIGISAALFVTFGICRHGSTVYESIECKKNLGIGAKKSCCKRARSILRVMVTHRD